MRRNLFVRNLLLMLVTMILNDAIILPLFHSVCRLVCCGRVEDINAIWMHDMSFKFSLNDELMIFQLGACFLYSLELLKRALENE